MISTIDLWAIGSKSESSGDSLPGNIPSKFGENNVDALLSYSVHTHTQTDRDTNNFLFPAHVNVQDDEVNTDLNEAPPTTTQTY